MFLAYIKSSFCFAETITELYSMSTTRTFTDTQLKCSSLPPGLTAPGSETKLNRSKSNAGSKSQDHFSPLHEEEKEERPSLFERIFPRKSGRKKKSKDEKDNASKHETKVTKEETVVKRDDVSRTEEVTKEEKVFSVSSTANSYSESYKATTNVVSKEVSRPIPAPRSGAASRQRMAPIDIPASPEQIKRDPDIILPKPSPEKSIMSTSPLQMELESRFKQRQVILNISF